MNEEGVHEAKQGFPRASWAIVMTQSLFVFAPTMQGSSSKHFFFGVSIFSDLDYLSAVGWSGWRAGPEGDGPAE